MIFLFQAICLGEIISEVRPESRSGGVTTASDTLCQLGVKTTGARHGQILIHFLSYLEKTIGRHRWQSSSDRRSVHKYIYNNSLFLARAHPQCTYRHARSASMFSAWLGSSGTQDLAFENVSLKKKKKMERCSLGGPYHPLAGTVMTMHYTNSLHTIDTHVLFHDAQTTSDCKSDKSKNQSAYSPLVILQNEPLP